MHFKYDNINMNIDRFEISLDLGKYIEYYCEQKSTIKNVHLNQNDYSISIV